MVSFAPLSFHQFRYFFPFISFNEKFGSFYSFNLFFIHFKLSMPISGDSPQQNEFKKRNIQKIVHFRNGMVSKQIMTSSSPNFSMKLFCAINPEFINDNFKRLNVFVLLRSFSLCLVLCLELNSKERIVYELWKMLTANKSFGNYAFFTATRLTIAVAFKIWKILCRK